MLLRDLQLFPVREIPQQYRRRIAFNATTGALGELSEIIEENGQSASGTQAYQDSLSNIVGFDGTPDGFERPLVNISGDDKKIQPFQYENRDTGLYNFVAVLVANPINDTRSQELRYIVTGYTSQAEQSLFGNLPNDMVLYINEIYGMQTVYDRTPLGERVINPNGFKMVDNLVLSRALATQGYHESSINAITISKTADMIKKMNLNPDEKFMPNEDEIYAPTATAAPTLLAGQLSQPENFVTAISNSYLRTMGMDNELTQVESFFEGTGGSNVESDLNALGVVRNFSNYDLIKAFRQALTNSLGSSADGYNVSSKAQFRLGDLKAAVANPDEIDRQIVASLDLARKLGLGEIEQTDQWIGHNGYSTMGSLVSYELAMQLGAILSRNLVSRVSFDFDNRHSDFLTPAQLTVHSDSIYSLSDRQLPRILAERFERDIHAMFVKVTKHNHIRCAIRVHALLGTVTRVEVLMDGESTKEFFTYASFMSSRLHNGNTTSLAYTGRLANDTSKLMKAIETGYHGHSTASNRSNIITSAPSSPNAFRTGNSLLDDDTPAAGIRLGTGNSLLD